MGNLLSSAIKMQGSAAASPKLQYSVTGYGGGSILVKRNGATIATLTAETAVTEVSITAGDTIQMTTSGTGPISTFIYYYINGVFQTSYSGVNPSTPVITSSGSNVYLFAFEGFA